MQFVVVDTDVVSYLMQANTRGTQFDPYLKGKVPAITFITVGELHHGALSRGWGEQKNTKLERTISRYVLLPWDQNLARLWGKNRATAKSMGHPLCQDEHSNDLWIVTCAIYHDAPILTNNRRHMGGFPGLRFADDEPAEEDGFPF